MAAAAPLPPGAREPAGRERRRSRRARRAHSRRAPSHPAASERDGLTDPAPAGPGQHRRRRGEAGEDTHTSPPPTRADPQQPGGGARARDGAPDRSRRGWHSRPAHTLTRGGGRAETRAPLHRGGGRARSRGSQRRTSRDPPHAQARARQSGGGGGARRRKGTDDPPRLHTTPPPGRTVAADTERRPQRAWEAPTHQSAPPGLVAERRRPRHGRLAARATRRRRRATGNRTAGQRQGSPTGFQPGALRGRSQVATGVRTGSHRPRPPAQGRSRGTPGRRPGPPPRRTLGQTLAEGPPALPPAAAARPAPGTLSRTRGDPPPAPRPSRTPDARSQRPFLSSSPHSFAHASGADSTPPGTRPPKSHGGPRGGRAPDKRRGLVSGPTR